MHFTPQQMRAMSMFDYLAALDGMASDGEAGMSLSEAEKDDLWEWLQADQSK
jgi:hypothetical protein